MEISVFIEPIEAHGFRPSCGEPIIATFEGTTREAALDGLRKVLEKRILGGGEVVRLQFDHDKTKTPVWPDDEFTRDWLEGIAAHKTQEHPEP